MNCKPYGFTRRAWACPCADTHETQWSIEHTTHESHATEMSERSGLTLRVHTLHTATRSRTAPRPRPAAAHTEHTDDVRRPTTNRQGPGVIRQLGSMYALHMETDVCVRHKPHNCVCCSKLNLHGFYNAYEMNTRVNTRETRHSFSKPISCKDNNYEREADGERKRAAP